MSATWHEVGRWLHLGGGFAAVALGAVAMFWPKFGRWSKGHRLVGQVYTILIASSCSLGTVLAYTRDNTYLMILGTVTLAVVVIGWLFARRARTIFARGDVIAAKKQLRVHLILMGASYIGAWSGFFATNPIFGQGHEALVWFYVFGPTIVGAIFIARAAWRLGQRR